MLGSGNCTERQSCASVFPMLVSAAGQLKSARSLAVSIRKSCEKACRWSAWRFAVATPVTALLMRVLSGRGRLCPGAEVLLARVPRQEPFQRRAGEWLPAVAAALVEVSGEGGKQVEAGHRGGGGDGEDDGGVPGGVPVMRAAGVLPGHDRTPDLALCDIVVQRYHRVVAVRGDAVPFAVQGGEGLLRGLGQAGGLHLLLPGLVDHGDRVVPGGLCLL